MRRCVEAGSLGVGVAVLLRAIQAQREQHKAPHRLDAASSGGKLRVARTLAAQAVTSARTRRGQLLPLGSLGGIGLLESVRASLVPD